MKKVILYGAGIIGKKALYCLRESVHCFADTYSYGNKLLGYDIISPQELQKIYQNYDVLICIGDQTAPSVKMQLSQMGIKADLFKTAIKPNDYFSDNNIVKYRDTHIGERCFIIGNGPSLNMNDLDLLAENNEYCFASNRIYKAFQHTKWRPDIYCAVDSNVVSDIRTIAHEVQCTKFISLLPYLLFMVKAKPDISLTAIINSLDAINGIAIHCLPNAPNKVFSDDVSKFVYDNMTVMFILLQLAKYFGFTQLYLLGCDNTPGDLKNGAEYIKQKSHFYEESINDYTSIINNRPHILLDEHTAERREVLANAAAAAEEYSWQNGFRIFNATRGGNLGVYERVNFDSLFCRDVIKR